MKKGRKRIGKRWTDAELKELARYLDEGMTTAEIAKRLGRNERAIWDKKYFLRMFKRCKFSPNDPRTVAQVVKFRMLGWQLKDIATVFEVYLQEVWMLLNANGFTGRWKNDQSHRQGETLKRWNEIEIARLRECLKRDDPFKEICRNLPNRSEKAVKHKSAEITRFWQSPAEHEERKRLREKHMQMRVY